MTTELTSNQYYRGLNRRSDKRMAQLFKAGFRYVQLATGVAGMQKVRYGREINIAMSMLLAADKRLWLDTLKSKLIRF